MATGFLASPLVREALDDRCDAQRERLDIDDESVAPKVRGALLWLANDETSP